jgi:hypothetical protein
VVEAFRKPDIAEYGQERRDFLNDFGRFQSTQKM